MINKMKEVISGEQPRLAMIVYFDNTGNIRDIVINESALKELYMVLKKRYEKEEIEEEKGATGGEVVE